jgi:hypothetical protein
VGWYRRDATDAIDLVLADWPPDEQAALADALRKLHQLLVANHTPAASP